MYNDLLYFSISGEKGRDKTKSYDISPYTIIKLKKQSDNACKNNTTIADRHKTRNAVYD